MTPTFCCSMTSSFYHGSTALMTLGLLHDSPRSYSVGLLWTFDWLITETSTWQHTDIHALAGFEPAIPASERPQSHALDSAGKKNTSTWIWCIMTNQLIKNPPAIHHHHHHHHHRRRRRHHHHRILLLISVSKHFNPFSIFTNFNHVYVCLALHSRF